MRSRSARLTSQRGPHIATPALDTSFLDGCRGIAALYVVIGHARWLLWEGHGSAQHHLLDYGPLCRALLYGLGAFRYGHQAVLFFFVLSGFVIHYPYARRLAADPTSGFDWLRFMGRRARRLYPPLLLAILLTGALDAIGSLLGYGIYARATPSALMNVSIGTDHSPVTLIGNLFFLMTAYVPVWGTNGPLWSLKFEWWFYVLYPLLRLCARRSPWPVAIALWAAFALTPFGSLWPLALVRQIASAYAVWWLGALLAERLAGRVTFNWFHAGTLAGLLLPLAAAHADGTRADALWGLAFFGLLSIAFGLKARGWRLAAFEATRWLGALSYTLYVVHFPILVLLSGWLMSRSPTAALPRHFGWVFVGTAATLLVAYAGHLFVERPFLSSRRNLAAPPQPLRKLAPARAAQGVPAFEPAAGGLEASGARSSEAGVARS